MSDLEDAWDELHEANEKLRWFVGPTTFEERRTPPWSQYAFDTTERPKVGHRSREWTATSMTEEGAVREMARCLREISEGRVRDEAS